MGVDLSRRDRSMTEELLDDTYISTICQKSRSKTMTKCMCVHIFQYASPESILLHHSRDEEACEAYFLVRELDRIYIFFTKIMSNK
jgi:hypothetical protein